MLFTTLKFLLINSKNINNFRTILPFKKTNNYNLMKIKLLFHSTSFYSNKNNLFVSTNLYTNPFINEFKDKITNSLSNNSNNKKFNNFVLNKLSKDRLNLIKELELLDYIQINKPLLFSSQAPKAFTELYKYNKMPGIYWLSSTLHNDISYVGHSINLYQRLINHKNYALTNSKRHPKLYNYVNKYGWEVMNIRVLTLVPNYELLFKHLYPNISLTNNDVKLLKLLTKYELLITEQYCIDVINPSLNLDTIVNVGGLINKGATGYVVSEEALLERSNRMKGRTFSPETIKLIKNKLTGRVISQETKDKMSLSNSGVKVYVYTLDFSNKTEYNTKSAAATALNISLRTLSRRIVDGKSIITENGIYIVSLNSNLTK
jgi:group I intron endonuclease